MSLILNPPKKPDGNPLRDVYKEAFGTAVELLIVSAYLTSWDKTIKLNSKCKELTVVIGKDFGITRKAACRDVLAWLPKDKKSDFLVAAEIEGFHPKLMAWVDAAGKRFVLLGSSNLTRAAFVKNYEANCRVEVPKKEFGQIRDWVYEIRTQSIPVSEGWLNKYSEAKPPPRQPKGNDYEPDPSADFKLPRTKNIEDEINARQLQVKQFRKIKRAMRDLIFACADGKIRSTSFYKRMMELWGNHPSRFQWKGFERKGKSANWRETCRALKSILEKPSSTSLYALDNEVKWQIDKLHQAGNPTRGSWFSEMLCQFFPDRYPVLNNPVKAWLHHIDHHSPRGASEGAKYVDLAQKLRIAVRKNKNHPAKNMADADRAICEWGIAH